jgi:hypothetical protein
MSIIIAVFLFISPGPDSKLMITDPDPIYKVVTDPDPTKVSGPSRSGSRSATLLSIILGKIYGAVDPLPESESEESSRNEGR